MSADEQNSFASRAEWEEWLAARHDISSGVWLKIAKKGTGIAGVSYEAQSTATVPDDLQVALDHNAAAAAFFATLDSRNRYAILHRIQDAKRRETRERRVQKYVAMLTAGEKIHP